MLLIITACPATLEHLRQAEIPFTHVPTVDDAERYLASTAHRGERDHVIAFGPDVATADSARRVNDRWRINQILVIPGEPVPADYSAATHLGLDMLLPLPRAAHVIAALVADAARTAVNA